MTPDANPAESSPAPAPVSGQALLDSFTPTERDSWEKSGSLPDRVTVTTSDEKPAASSTDQPADQAASTEVIDTPASEPGKPKGDKLRARNTELDAENAELREKLRIRHALREELASLDRAKPDAKVDSSPAPTLTEWQRYMALPGAPKEDDFSSYGEFTAAQALFIADKRFEDHQARAFEQTQRSERDTAIAKTADEAATRVREYAEAHPEFEAQVDDRLLAIAPLSALPADARITPQNVLAEEIIKSPVTPQLLQHFSTDEGRKDWQRLCAMPPNDLLRAFGRLEARFDDGAPPAAPTKHTSSAPAPATVLGARPADTADPIASAVRDKDYSRYEREANKADLASLHR